MIAEKHVVGEEFVFLPADVDSIEAHVALAGREDSEFVDGGFYIAVIATEQKVTRENYSFSIWYSTTSSYSPWVPGCSLASYTAVLRSK